MNRYAYKKRKVGGKILPAYGQNTLTQKLSQIFATPAMKLLHLQQLGSEEFKNLAEE